MLMIEALKEADTDRQFHFEEDEEGRFSIYKRNDGGERKIASFRCVEMPGCNGVGVFHRFWISESERARGLGKALMPIKLRAAKAAGYGSVICTVLATDAAQQRILTENGFTTGVNFLNPKTGNAVQIYAKIL